MAQQHYSNHVRYYPPHHFVFYPVVLVCLVAAFRLAYTNPGQKTVWLFMGVIIFLLGWLSFMLRQHYALTLQNRLVRLEMRYRYYRLTQQAFEPLELQLSFGQLAALRFAPDNELVALLQKTLRENLSPKDIKQSIVNWLPDNMRV